MGPPPEPPPAAPTALGPLPAPGTACVSWRQTGMCVATGPREPGNDRPCPDAIQSGWSGFCECAGGTFVGADCGHPVNNCLTVCSQVTWSAPMIVPAPLPASACVAWRQTGMCRATGPREPSNDKPCGAQIASGWSGFCECASGRVGVDCGHSVSNCQQACAAGAWR